MRRETMQHKDGGYTLVVLSQSQYSHIPSSKLLLLLIFSHSADGRGRDAAAVCDSSPGVRLAHVSPLCHVPACFPTIYR